MAALLNLFVIVMDVRCGTVQVGVVEARGLPPVLSNFVFCQYSFWTHAPTTVPSLVIHSNDDDRPQDDVVVHFNHSQASTVNS